MDGEIIMQLPAKQNERTVESINMPPSDYLLESFTEVRTVKDFNPLDLELLSEKYRRITQWDIFPTNYTQNYIQKSYIIPSKYTITQGPNGDKDYISFLSLAIDLAYKERDIKGLQAFLMFPIRTLGRMLDSAIFLWFDGFVKAYHDQVVELHFRKVTRRKYELLFLSTVQHVKDKEFRRVRIDYRHPKYDEDTGRLRK